MNWIATNIRFREDQYMRLKIKAAEERKSVAAVLREAANKVIGGKNTALKGTEQAVEAKVREFMKDIEKIAKENSRHLPKGFDSVKALREIRYGER